MERRPRPIGPSEPTDPWPPTVRLLAAIALFLFYSFVIGLASVAAGILDRSGRWARRVAQVWGRAVLHGFGVRVEVFGAENLPHGPAVFAANHTSALDIPLVFGWLPADFRIIHKRSLYAIPIAGWFLYFGGHIPIERSRAFRARRSLSLAAERIRKGTSVVVFPEGTRNPSGDLGAFKKGSFVLARESGVPIVPVSLAGVADLAGRGLLRARAGRVRVTVHAPIPTVGVDDAHLDDLVEAVRSAIRHGGRAGGSATS
jgi:1-acyl-sn-glycerol-3-phosphate acyltransferase